VQGKRQGPPGLDKTVFSHPSRRLLLSPGTLSQGSKKNKAVLQHHGVALSLHNAAAELDHSALQRCRATEESKCENPLFLLSAYS